MSLLARISILIVILSVCQFAYGQGRRGRGGYQGGGGDNSGGYQGGAPSSDSTGGYQGGGGRFQRGGGDQGSGPGFGGGRFQRGGGDRGNGDQGSGPGFGGGRFQRGGGDQGGGPGGPMSSEAIAQRLARTTDFLNSIDTNHNGMIDVTEASDPNAKGMLDRILGRIGKEPHYPMSITEITQAYEAYYRSRANGAGGPPGGLQGVPPGATPSPTTPQSTVLATASLQSPPGMGFGTAPTPSLGSFSSNRPGMPGGYGPMGQPSSFGGPPQVSTSASTSTADSKTAAKKPTRFLTASERLPKGLPAWFVKADVNSEGQVTMAQYATDWTPQKVQEFNRYDLNGDGIITADEVLKVTKSTASSK